MFRVALMFGICLGHALWILGNAVVVGHPLREWLVNVNHSCVNGFVFITGYYGIRFRPSKVMRLYAVALWCGALTWLLGRQLGIAHLPPLREALVGFWFLNAYCVLMLVAPMVNAVLDQLPGKMLAGVVAPFFVLTFGWAFLTEQPFFRDVLPTTPGMGSFTGLALVAIYVVARLCRRFDVGRFFTWKRAVVTLAVLVVLTGIGMGEYSSPFATALAGVCFYLFLNVRWPQWVGRMACLLGPSMFAVYLLHTNSVGFALLKGMEERLFGQGVPMDGVYWIGGALAFAVCVLIDVPRRLLTWGLAPLWQVPLRWVDACWTRFFPER